LTEDWAGAFSSADAESASSAQRLRARARQLERDNPFVERYLKLLGNNVLGAYGIGLQMKVRDPDRMEGGKIKRGGYDTLANATVESGWHDWTRGRNCCVDGGSSLFAVENLALRSAARDGAMFIILHEGAGKYGLQLECFEADFLREDYSEALTNGNIVRYGVEMTPQRKPVAYHFFNRHPHDSGSVSGGLRAARPTAFHGWPP
jgi:capsid protein